MNSPISIVIRSMDRPALKRALDSVSAQRLKPREIVVVAACGSRHGPLPAVDPAITARLVFPDAGLERLNRPQAGNTGLRATTQDWIGFLDDDDEYLPEHLETLFPAAQQFFQAGGLRGRLAYSLAQGIDRAGNATDLYGRSFSFVHIWDNTLVHTMNALFHRSLLAEGVVFDESLDILEDWDF
ncbi:MAG TPA: glycosyltransferase family A protein, partial [Usitatibacteraceae bacterium]|nr:glycosyltransferase family A protein [Usitatibacteraceae bacterium]